MSGDSTESDKESSKSEKVHTNVSLFSKFRVALTNNNLLYSYYLLKSTFSVNKTSYIEYQYIVNQIIPEDLQ